MNDDFGARDEVREEEQLTLSQVLPRIYWPLADIDAFKGLWRLIQGLRGADVSLVADATVTSFARHSFNKRRLEGVQSEIRHILDWAFAHASKDVMTRALINYLERDPNDAFWIAHVLEADARLLEDHPLFAIRWAEGDLAERVVQAAAAADPRDMRDLLDAAVRTGLPLTPRQGALLTRANIHGSRAKQAAIQASIERGLELGRIDADWHRRADFVRALALTTQRPAEGHPPEATFDADGEEGHAAPPVRPRHEGAGAGAGDVSRLPALMSSMFGRDVNQPVDGMPYRVASYHGGRVTEFLGGRRARAYARHGPR